MIAISVENVEKKFRRVAVGGGYTTIKSLFLRKDQKQKLAESADDKAFYALKDVSFDIPKGETWGIIGRNGSGKSTLLKLMAGIYKPDAGKLTVDGKISALIELGAGFHPEFSGRENIYINASILGMYKSQIREKFDEIVAFAELEEFIDNPVRTYSSGMFARLGFSVAIHADPDILLVDEVLAVGDESFSHKCKDKINSFRKEGKTIIVVTHNLADVDILCDNVVWLEKGVIKDSGSPKRITDTYMMTVAESDNKVLLHEHESDSEETDQADRWGTREAEITKVTMYDNEGNERYLFKTGDEVAVVIEYIAHATLLEPVFGVGIHKQDGSHCFGTNTNIDDVVIDSIEGKGKVTMKFDRLELIEDSYTLSVAIHAKDGHPYDYHNEKYKFSIRSTIKDVGVYRPPHKWSVNGTSKPEIKGAKC